MTTLNLIKCLKKYQTMSSLTVTVPVLKVIVCLEEIEIPDLLGARASIESFYRVAQKLPQICTVILRIRIGKVA